MNSAGDIIKAVILAGGLGTRISEETSTRPKPMVEVGGMPILWHIMKMYSQHGINEFIICLGYKGYAIKEYFANYFLHTSDVTMDLSDNSIEVHHRYTEPWKVTLVDTGEATMTGGRLKRIRSYLTAGEPFCMTYGDGVSDVDITRLIAHHTSAGLDATLTATIPPGRFGALDLAPDGRVNAFQEKPDGDGGMINGGFFVLDPKVIDLVDGDDTVWEQGPLEKLAKSGQLSAFTHTGFWQPMDTLRDKNYLEALWAKGEAPWKTWA
jgi:glucose-1-phosphate cytidylyltransferase